VLRRVQTGRRPRSQSAMNTDFDLLLQQATALRVRLFLAHCRIKQRRGQSYCALACCPRVTITHGRNRLRVLHNLILPPVKHQQYINPTSTLAF
jgi:hypothetical protein